MDRLCHTHWMVVSCGQDWLGIFLSSFGSFPSAGGSLELGLQSLKLGLLRAGLKPSLGQGSSDLGTQFLLPVPAQAQPFLLEGLLIGWDKPCVVDMQRRLPGWMRVLLVALGLGPCPRSWLPVLMLCSSSRASRVELPNFLSCHC